MSKVALVEMRRAGSDVAHGVVESRSVALVEVRRAGGEVSTDCVRGRTGCGGSHWW